MAFPMRKSPDGWYWLDDDDDDDGDEDISSISQPSKTNMKGSSDVDLPPRTIEVVDLRDYIYPQPSVMTSQSSTISKETVTSLKDNSQSCSPTSLSVKRRRIEEVCEVTDSGYKQETRSEKEELVFEIDGRVPANRQASANRDKALPSSKFTSLVIDLVDSDDEDVSSPPTSTLHLGNKRKRSRRQRRPPIIEFRNQKKPNWRHEDLVSYKYNGLRLRKGTVVELIDHRTFLKITRIFKDIMANKTFLSGHMFRSLHCVKGFPSQSANEVCWLLDIDSDDFRKPEAEQCLETIPIRDVLKVRQLIMTNKSFSELASSNQANDDPLLVCRTKLCNYHKDAIARSRGEKFETAVVFLRKSECDADACEENEDLRHRWRRFTHPFGAEKDWRDGEAEFLQQELVSSKGDRCTEPLKTNERDYIGGQDAMERPMVAPILIPCQEGSQFYFRITGHGLAMPTVSIIDKFSGETIIRAADIVIDQKFNLLKELKTIMPIHEIYRKAGAKKLQIRDDEVVIIPEKFQGPTRNRAQQVPHRKPIPSFPPINRQGLGSRYTFGDCFCGAGGMSRGAVLADVSVSWGFDKDYHACISFARNFIGSNVYCMDANEIISMSSQVDMKVDICHFSPPCQPFSGAHTTTGQDDEVNRLALLTVGALLDKAKPRIAILEETLGLTAKKHEKWFTAVLEMFIERSFSIRYKKVICADYGLAQKRPRLFLIASCPGERLPKFPAPTHMANPPLRSKLKPYTSINSAISQIPDHWPNHAKDNYFQIPKDEYPGNQLTHCVKTSGSGDYHPSGFRNFTHRENACLQGFPLCHKFSDQGVLKQIGNAVAPIVAKAILDEVVAELEYSDTHIRD